MKRSNNKQKEMTAALYVRLSRDVSGRSHRSYVHRLRRLDRRLHGCAAAKRRGKGLRRRCRLRSTGMEPAQRSARDLHGAHERALYYDRADPGAAGSRGHGSVVHLRQAHPAGGLSAAEG